MQKTKKILCILLSVCMLLAFLPAISFAGGTYQYSVWDENAKTLTFCVGYLDGNTVTRTGSEEPHTVTGTSVFLSENHLNKTASINSAVEKIIFLDAFTVTSCKSAFSHSENLTEIQGLPYLNTAQAQEMSGMFAYCSRLTSLDLSGLSTESATCVNNMFEGCSSLTSLDLSGFHTETVTDMSEMFKDCTSLTSLDLSSFHTENVADMREMFSGCSALRSIQFSSNFNTANVTNMSAMFMNCVSLTGLDLSGFTTANVEDMSGMFVYCAGLTSLDLRNFNTAKVTNMLGMFGLCTALRSLDVSSFTIGEDTVTDGMFVLDSALSSLKLGTGFRFNDGHAEVNNLAQYQFVNACLPDAPNNSDYTGKWVLEGSDLYHFTSAELMENYDGATMAGTWVWEPPVAPVSTEEAYAVLNTSAQTLTFCVGTLEADGVHRTAGGTVTGNLYFTGFITEQYDDKTPWDQYHSSIQNVDFADPIAPASTALWFAACENLTGISNPENLDLTNTTSMWNMFCECTSLTALDLHMWDTSHVTDMHGLFHACTALESVNLRGWNTGNVTDMTDMFCECSSLTTLDLSGFNTANVESMDYMFGACEVLTSVNLSDFNTENVKTMEAMFCECPALTALNLSSFHTVNAESMAYLFADSEAIASLTLGENFRFITGYSEKDHCDTYACLPDAPQDETHTGFWIKVGGDGTHYTAQQLMEDSYAGAVSMAGTWIWETIVPAVDISDATVVMRSQPYTGEAVRPEVTVTLHNVTLIEGTDYYVTYSHNTAVGTATVTVTGIGAYTGTLSCSFEITEPVPISAAKVTVDTQSCTDQTTPPTVTVKLGDVTLTEDTDYTVRYSFDAENNRGAVVVTGIGAYTDTVTFTFRLAAPGPDPTPDPGPAPTLSFLELIKAFFLKIVEFFRSIC